MARDGGGAGRPTEARVPELAAALADLLERLKERRILLGEELARDRLGRADVDSAITLQGRSRRNQLAGDHVLLQPEQTVDLALDRGVRQHLRPLLERGRGEEALGRERCLRD